MSATTGKVKDIIFAADIEKNIIDSFMWGQRGDVVTDVMTTKFGIVFMQFQSHDEQKEKTNNIHDLIRVVTE